jgi:hypothetical protein
MYIPAFLQCYLLWYILLHAFRHLKLNEMPDAKECDATVDAMKYKW